MFFGARLSLHSKLFWISIFLLTDILPMCVCVCIYIYINFQGHDSFGLEAAPAVGGMHSLSSRFPREHAEHSKLSTIPEEVSIADFLFSNFSNKRTVSVSS